MKNSEIFNEWRRWLFPAIPPPPLLSEVDEEAVAPLLLRQASASPFPLLVVCPTLTQAEHWFAEMCRWREYFKIPLTLCHLPDATEKKRFIPENEAERVRVLHETMTGCAHITIASVTSVLTAVPPPEHLTGEEITIRTGMRLDFNLLLERLVKMDYDDEFEVCVKGEFARRGGIIDVFSPAHEFPARIEFWGNDIESVRRFDPATQRSTGETGDYRIIRRSSFTSCDSADFLDYLRPHQPVLTVVFPEECLDHLEKFAEPEHLAYWRDTVENFPDERRALYLNDSGSTVFGEAVPAGCYPAAAHLRKSLPGELSGDGLSVIRKMIAMQLEQWLETGYTVNLLGKDSQALIHLREWCAENGIPENRIGFTVADFPAGLLLPEEKKVFLSEKEIFAVKPRKRNIAAPSRRQEFNPVAEEEVFKADIDEGDLVVHLVHGIGIFRGIRETARRGSCREVLAIEYQNQAMVYVPVWQASMVNKYIGARAGSVTLHKLGGKNWLKAKIEAERSVRAFALDMLRVQALRNSATGCAFPPDDLAQRVFEDSFPFEDTPDQAQSAADIKRDMCTQSPMDRLLCGDVGYGKTEIAIRAAFKAVMAGRQVAVLVPTTILAQQHYYSFCERFAGYPVNIEMLSRFRSRQEQCAVIGKLKDHRVDIVIGTHRLLQDDVHFAALGLVVIDEEQRFGVEHKERLKSFRATVDILTMTATPIPRTLYMSMAGLRDLSTIATAPGLRLPVHTVVAPHDDNFIDEAIRSEVQRGGQVFYLHNRVKSIDSLTDKLRKRLPEIRFGIGHGQMEENHLEQVMSSFLAGKIDVLVCTTIIESGLDIPNANTIIIEHANRFGLAELYQLRGRVGRWNRQAYAYLMLPKGDVITGDARRRLAAIRRYTHLGAGFKLALRDLEIRGAGNLLGADQSGHINSVGYDLYCQLLRSTVAQLKGESVEILPELDISIDFIEFAHIAEDGRLAAGFPPDYINSERLRIEAYRRLSNMFTEEQIDQFEQELEDRFGKLPETAANMLKTAKIRIIAARAGFRSLKVQDGKILLENKKGIFRFDNGRIPMVDLRNPPASRLDHLFQMLGNIAARIGHDAP